MNDTPTAAAHDDHAGHGPNVKVYMAIFGALLVCTLVSFVANAAKTYGTITPTASFVIIMSVAVLKATLVGMYFMHLTYDWGKLYFMIVPTMILGPMLIIVLLPDIVLAWR